MAGVNVDKISFLASIYLFAGLVLLVHYTASKNVMLIYNDRSKRTFADFLKPLGMMLFSVVFFTYALVAAIAFSGVGDPHVHVFIMIFMAIASAVMGVRGAAPKGSTTSDIAKVASLCFIILIAPSIPIVIAPLLFAYLLNV